MSNNSNIPGICVCSFHVYAHGFSEEEEFSCIKSEKLSSSNQVSANTLNIFAPKWEMLLFQRVKRNQNSRLRKCTTKVAQRKRVSYSKLTEKLLGQRKLSSCCSCYYSL